MIPLHHRPAWLAHGNAAASGGRTRVTLLTTGLVLALALFLLRDLLRTSWTLAALRVDWRERASGFLLSDEDGFDITFANYSRGQLSAAPYHDVIPPVLHHIALGMPRTGWPPEWEETVRSCLELHPGWTAHLWTDENAASFVADRFPELYDMWESYPYPIERVDALRYMVLHEYGGAILDMDLRCRRGLGPLRRFEFVAPEAHPTGFSISFLMASRHNTFVRDVLRHLTEYNRRWLGLPYPTVMFSTGGHFASVIHAAQPDRSPLKILPGPLHSLNGRVTTPLFEHLGSSSWHSYDAQLITSLGASARFQLLLLLGLFLSLGLFLRWRRTFRL
ncbi:glycosyl transferase [Drechmeria coniospora]|uniref:Glycosyl transferase n=1 Tax=Drechmeria coniospora TaxID=98403 RepID=A0A151GT33_DRECN|nr:glycosyl transferase [Drechmeria coniospora]KYK60238.1 glycosyl transferase [Drechmeria coniospora]ODA80180.1 hypothetical protein RJ55_03138 [Drechmeria coniospora]